MKINRIQKPLVRFPIELIERRYICTGWHKEELRKDFLKGGIPGCEL